MLGNFGAVIGFLATLALRRLESLRAFVPAGPERLALEFAAVRARRPLTRFSCEALGDE